MKKATLLFIGLIAVTCLCAQDQVQNENGSYYKQCTSFGISKSFRELSETNPAPYTDKEIEAGDAESDREPLPEPSADALREVDPIIQTTDGTALANAPLINFAGSTDGYLPCDPSGAASSKYYVQAVNDLYRVFDKNGKALINTVKMSTLWPSGGSSLSDPIVLYDKFADRWLISMLDVSNKAILIAISTTNDPTGTFYLYNFVPQSGVLVDYPKYSIWPDGYYMVSNTGTEKIAIYERDKMIKGDKTAGMIVATLTGTKRTSAFFCPVALDADGELPPLGSPNYVMSYEDNSWGSSYKDQLNIVKVSANWSSKTATVSADPSLPVPSFTGILTSGRNDIPQPGTSVGLDGTDGLLMYRAPYRIWTGYNSVVLSHVTNIGNGVAGIRWYELRQDNTTKAWSIFQQGTYAPSDGLYRWEPSIAMDDNGSIALCYAAGSGNISASLRYTGRLATDPPGVMSFTEQIAMSGSGAQTSTTSRFGDYSHTSLDPDGVTFWHTGEYINSSSRATRVYSFKLPLSISTSVKENKKQAEFNVYQNDNELIVKANYLANNDNVVVDLFDITGKLIKGNVATPVANMLQSSIDVNGLSKGVYLVRIGNIGFQKVIKVIVN